MKIEMNEELKFYGYVDHVNTSTYDTIAVNVITEENERITVRVKKELCIKQNKIYFVKGIVKSFKEKLQLFADEIIIIDECKIDDEKISSLMKQFYNYAPISMEEAKTLLEDCLSSIENKVIKDITECIYRNYEYDFYLYPAATKFHHAYIGGLAYHTTTMLKLAKNFQNVYSFLNKDLLYAGIILHDICKTIELTSYEGPEYSKVGKLLGHITLGVNEITLTADKLGYRESEEALLLQHMVLSHHYYGNFGSPKKPNIPEALILHFLDNIDSKMCVVGEELDAIDIGSFTQPIGVVDREKYYKHKLFKK